LAQAILLATAARRELRLAVHRGRLQVVAKMERGRRKQRPRMGRRKRSRHLRRKLTSSCCSGE
jgi:hypothetical protein